MVDRKSKIRLSRTHPLLPISCIICGYELEFGNILELYGKAYILCHEHYKEIANRIENWMGELKDE